MEPLESGQIQPLGLSHAIGPPGWRPYFQRGIPSILKRLKHPKPDHQSLWWTFPLAPLAPPLPPPWPKDPLPADSRDPATSRGATRPISVLKGVAGPSAPPWAALGPPWTPLGPPARAGPPWAPPALGRPGPPYTPALLSPPSALLVAPPEPPLGPPGPPCAALLWAPLGLPGPP